MHAETREQGCRDVRRDVVAVPDEDVRAGAVVGHRQQVARHQDDEPADRPLCRSAARQSEHGQRSTYPVQLLAQPAPVVGRDDEQIPGSLDPAPLPETAAQQHAEEAVEGLGIPQSRRGFMRERIGR